MPHEKPTDAVFKDRRIRLFSTNHGCHHHRSGWEHALTHLGRMAHPNGMLFDSMVENTFVWHLPDLRARLPLREPWIGVVHNPPSIPETFFPGARPQNYTSTDAFQRSLEQCRGILALSEHQARWFRGLGVPVDVVLHPVDLDVPAFSWDAYRTSAPRRVLHIGWWLRRLQSFNELSAPRHRKVLLQLPDPNAERAIGAVAWDGVEIIPYQSNASYDRLLAQSVVFADLIDASANNVVLDCVACATPLVVNRHPAVVEYLGAGYPLFYDSIGQAAALLESDDRLLEAHRYLSEPSLRQRFSGDAFVAAVRATAVYRSLPAR